MAAVVLDGGSSAALTRLDLLFLAGLAAFVGWIAASLGWSGTPDTVLEIERVLVYVAGMLAVLLVVAGARCRTFLAAS